MSRISSMLLECTITYNKIKTKFNKKKLLYNRKFFPQQVALSLVSLRSHDI